MYNHLPHNQAFSFIHAQLRSHILTVYTFLYC